MNRHPYADILIAIAEGKQIQNLTSEFEWIDLGHSEALSLINISNPVLRVKPSTIRIGEYDVPEPIREMPKNKDCVWLVNLGGTLQPFECKYNADIITYFANGLLHKTKEDAEIHAKAIISLSANKG